MWFTRISINNPWLATMVMLAFVVLGLFSYQRLQVDQFPDIDFPVVVVQTDYPGASPEIVESRGHAEDRGSRQHASPASTRLPRARYEGTSVVIVEFQLTVDRRKAAEDVREKVAADPRRCSATRSRSRASLRFDPADRPISSFAVLPSDAASAACASSPPGRPGAQEAAGERARRRLGHAGRRHQARDQHLPEAGGDWRRSAIGVDQVVAAVRSENQELPLGAMRSLEQERVVQIRRAHEAARGLRPHHRRTRAAAQPITRRRRSPTVRRRRAGAREPARSTTASARCCSTVQKAQGENTIEVGRRPAKQR